jgi:hypothetical protein
MKTFLPNTKLFGLSEVQFDFTPFWLLFEGPSDFLEKVAKRWQHFGILFKVAQKLQHFGILFT